MDHLLQDLRYAVRTLRRTPLLTSLAVLCLALGIGANVTMFSVVHSTLIQPLPFADSDRLVDLWSTPPGSPNDRTEVSYPDFRDWARELRSVTAMAAVEPRSLTLSGGRDPERVQGAAISAGLFEMLGVTPVLGRDIAAHDDAPGAPRALLLSDELWRRRYLADPDIVGTSVLVNDLPHTVIGVLPPEVKFPFQQVAYVALAPLVHPGTRTDRDLELFGRLAPGATVDRAREELKAIAARLAAEHPGNAGWSAHVRPLRDYFAPTDVRLVILSALGAVTLVLLIACANVASLLLARASARRREMSLRAALGAGRWRLVQQLLTEALLLGLLSVPLGVLLADVGLALVTAGIPADDVPYLVRFSLNRTALAYTVAVAALSSVAAGLAPAWQASQVDLLSALRDGGRTGNAGGRTRGRNALVVAEVALSLVLLVGASLFVRSFLNLQQSSPGFETGPILTLRIYLPGERYEGENAKARRVADILDRVERLPGVEAAGASNLVPLHGGGGVSRLVVDGRPVEPGREPQVYFAGVTARFFEALDVSVLRGRGLTRAEAETASAVALVNVSFVRRYLAPEGAPVSATPRGERRLRGAADLGALDPTGSRIRLLDAPQAPWLTIVGVLPDMMASEMGDNPERPSIFVAYPHQETPNTGFIIRTAGDPASLATAVRAAIRDADPGLPIFSVATMEEVRRQGFWQVQLFSWMFSIFGGLALLLGSAGVYGVLAYAALLRTQEFGVRIALGANAGDVLWLTIAQGLRLIAAGVAIGVVGALAITRVIATLLYNVTPTDPVSFAAVVLLLGLVGLLACYLPARRASRVDPMVALRSD